ncbi:hypothetical protein CAPTEDRAFT_211739, partial [Capitella teleta]
MSVESKVNIDKLGGQNDWQTWKFQMKHLLKAKGLWGIVNGTEELQVGANEEQTTDFCRRSERALAYVVLHIERSQLYLTIKKIVDQLAAIGVTIDEEDQVMTLLGSLPESFDTIVTALETQEIMTPTVVQQALINAEQKKLQARESKDEQILVASHSSGSGESRGGFNRGHCNQKDVLKNASNVDGMEINSKDMPE